MQQEGKGCDARRGGHGYTWIHNNPSPAQGETLWEFKPEPAKLRSNLCFTATHIYYDLLQAFSQHPSNKLHLTSSWWATYILAWKHHQCWLHLKAYCSGNSQERFAHAVIFFQAQSLLAAHNTGASQRNFISQGSEMDGWFLPVHTHYSAGFVQVLPAARVWI